MNLILLITNQNKEEIREFCLNASGKMEKSGSAIAVSYDGKVKPEEVASIVSPIIGFFSANQTTRSLVNQELSPDGQKAVLFSTFITQLYSRFPGEWLVVDGYANPKNKGFMVDLLKAHKVSMKSFSGKLVEDGKSLVPVGPLVISIIAKELRHLVACTGEGWRSRGRWLFNRGSTNALTDEEYPFHLTKDAPKEENKSEIKEDGPYSSLSMDELRAFYQEKTGSLPHHASKRAKIEADLASLETAAE